MWAQARFFRQREAIPSRISSCTLYPSSAPSWTDQPAGAPPDILRGPLLKPVTYVRLYMGFLDQVSYKEITVSATHITRDHILWFSEWKWDLLLSLRQSLFGAFISNSHHVAWHAPVLCHRAPTCNSWPGGKPFRQHFNFTDHEFYICLSSGIWAYTIMVLGGCHIEFL